MRVAFTLFGGEAWTGGINYLKNLLCAIQECADNNIEPILFHSNDSDIKAVESLRPFLPSKPIIVPEWGSTKTQKLKKVFKGEFIKNRTAEKHFIRENIDLVFQNGTWYGPNFSIPTLAWIPDFQHKHIPHMFSKANNLKRNIGYSALSYCATRILVSSEDARQDCEIFLPKSLNKISVLPFCVKPILLQEPFFRRKIPDKYSLPNKYFYLPNQFWQHKNHICVIEALNVLQQQKKHEIVIVSSGNPKDFRNPLHPQRIFDLVKKYNLSKNFIFLGMIPYEDIIPLMRGSIAVINPSYFEGWSTTVEEAKSVGAPLLLSDIRVHREQAKTNAEFFPPSDHLKLAEILEQKNSSTLSERDRNDLERDANFNYQNSREKFSKTIVEIFQSTLNSHTIKY